MSGEVYLWLKAFHLIAVIAWMAGMLYLPRLYVYHAQLSPATDAYDLFKVMEHRLLRYIMTPAMLLTWGLGLTLALYTNAFNPGNGMWLHYKLLLVLALSGIHGMLAMHRKRFAGAHNEKSHRYFKILNESVTVLLIAIVILAVVKPI